MAIVGRILVGYGELEFSLMHAVQMARKGDFDSTLKAMFRVRGEAQRIQIADALGRQSYNKLGLAQDFEEMMSAMDHCRAIRNQYAHAYWHDYSGLCLVDLEGLAKQDEEVINLTATKFAFLDLALLEAQENYLSYTDKLIGYINFQGRFLAGQLTSNPRSKPQPSDRPVLWLRKVTP
jgi:hypothetical protein